MKVPVRSNWLNQFITEAFDPSMAIRGSRYRGAAAETLSLAESSEFFRSLRIGE